MSNNKTSVIIVGAGPTGLMAANQLARFGVDFQIIDSKSGPTRESRALVVQGRTMEAYQQMGIADRAMEEGYPIKGMNIHTNGQHRVRVPVGTIGKNLSPFPFLLVLEQSRNEKILLDNLEAQGQRVLWNTSFQTISQDASGVRLTYQNGSGAEESVDAQWVIAADGASSPVRHALNMPFEGGTYGERFYVADLQIDGDVLHAEGSIHFAKEGFALILPMDGEQHFRLVGIVPSTVATDNPTFADVEKDLAPIFRKSLTFSSPNWFSSYTVHHRCVDCFQSGRVLFAGDAAHIHSPAGGQGMNTGLLDAHNLAWKLALITKGIAHQDLAKTYNEERLPFAQWLLSTTDRAFQAAMARDALSVFIRTRLLPRFAKTAMLFSATRRRFFRTISQIGITHRGRTLSVDHGTGKDRLAAGDRLPPFDIEVNKTKRSTVDLLAEPDFHVIDFAPPATARKNTGLVAQISEEMSIPIRYAEAICLDPDWRRDVEGRTYLIRPDMYLGMATAELSDKQLRTYFRQTLKVVD